MSQTLTILKQERGQKIPRPVNDVGSSDELISVLAYADAFENHPGNTGAKLRHAKAAMDRADADPSEHASALGIKLWNVDKEEPIHVTAAGTKFYAFFR